MSPMRIAVTSDLHFDVTPQNRQLVLYLFDEMKRQSPDALVLAGDLANPLAGWGEVLRHFQPLPFLKLVVPGTAGTISRSAIFDLTRISGMTNTSEGTLADANGSIQVWNDTRYAAWLRDPHSNDWRKRRHRLTAREVCTNLTNALEPDCLKIAGDVTKFVVAIHTNPFRNCITPRTPPGPFDAFEGSVRLGELMVRRGANHKVMCVCGHRYQPLDIIESGIRAVRAPVGYLDRFKGDYEALAAEVVRVLDV